MKWLLVLFSVSMVFQWFFILSRLIVISGQVLFRDELELVENSECKTHNNLWGVCKRVSQCPQIKLNISISKICSFAGNEAIVCCVRSSQLACLGYQIDVGELFKLSEQTFFIGGTRAKLREHPHMAAIGWSTGLNIAWKCGGSLISENFLITAAHCTRDRGIPPDIVRAGVVNLEETDPTSPIPIDYNITEILIHPQYKIPATYNDIALLRIIPLIISTPLRTICLWPNFELSTQQLEAMGFGTTSFGGRPSNKLYHGTLRYVPQKLCKAIYESNRSRRLSDGIIPSQMCAQDPDDTKDTCQGDSGGPLQMIDDLTGKKYLVGITSFGQGCLGSIPGVYTRINSYLDWIENVVWPEFLT